MEKYYRVEFVYENGQRIAYGTFLTTMGQIRKALENNLRNHPTVEVYAKTGKRVLDTFRG